MAGNQFDIFDEAAPTLGGGPQVEDDNPFSQFDSIEPPKREAPAQESPQLAPVQNVPGVSVFDVPQSQDLLTCSTRTTSARGRRRSTSRVGASSS